jgi:hypothetical protein
VLLGIGGLPGSVREAACVSYDRALVGHFTMLISGQRRPCCQLTHGTADVADIALALVGSGATDMLTVPGGW